MFWIKNPGSICTFCRIISMFSTIHHFYPSPIWETYIQTFYSLLSGCGSRCWTSADLFFAASMAALARSDMSPQRFSPPVTTRITRRAFKMLRSISFNFGCIWMLAIGYNWTPVETVDHKWFPFNSSVIKWVELSRGVHVLRGPFTLWGGVFTLIHANSRLRIIYPFYGKHRTASHKCELAWNRPLRAAHSTQLASRTSQIQLSSMGILFRSPKMNYSSFRGSQICPNAREFKKQIRFPVFTCSNLELQSGVSLHIVVLPVEP